MNHAAVSQLQCDAFLETFATTRGLTAQDRADVLESAMAIPWIAGDAERITTSLTSVARPSVTRRRMNQSYDSLVMYGTEAWWATVTAVGKEDQLQMLLTLGLTLGLRNPTEHCLKFLTSFWVVLSKHGDAAMSPSSKNMWLNYVRQSLHKLRKHRDDPVHYFERLPEPSNLHRTHPDIFRLVCGDAIPTQPPVDMSVVRALDDSFGCRGGVRAADRGAGSASPELGNSAMSMLVDAMAKNQQHLMQYVMAGNVGGSGGGCRGDIPITFTQPTGSTSGIVVGTDGGSRGTDRPITFTQPTRRPVHMHQAFAESLSASGSLDRDASVAAMPIGGEFPRLPPLCDASRPTQGLQPQAEMPQLPLVVQRKTASSGNQAQASTPPGEDV